MAAVLTWKIRLSNRMTFPGVCIVSAATAALTGNPNAISCTTFLTLLALAGSSMYLEGANPFASTVMEYFSLSYNGNENELPVRNPILVPYGRLWYVIRAVMGSFVVALIIFPSA